MAEPYVINPEKGPEDRRPTWVQRRDQVLVEARLEMLRRRAKYAQNKKKPKRILRIEGDDPDAQVP